MSGMESIVVEAELAVQDLRALQHYCHARNVESRTTGDLVRMVLTLILFAAPAVLLLGYTDGSVQTFSFLAGTWIALTTVIIVLRSAMKPSQNLSDSSALGRMRMTFDAAGMQLVRAGQSGAMSWMRVERIDETADHIFLALDRMTAVVVPKRWLTSITPAEFLSRIRVWHVRGKHDVTSDTVLARTEALEAAVPLPEFAKKRDGFWSDLGRNLRTGARIVAMRPVQASDLVVSFDQIAALLLVAVALDLSFEAAAIKPTSTFYYWSLYAWAAILVLGLGASAIITRLTSPRADTRVMLVALLTVAPWAITAIWALSLLPQARSELLFPLATAIVVMALGMRIVRVAHGYITGPSAAILIVTAALVAAGTERDYLYARLLPTFGEDAEERVTAENDNWEAAESTLFAQPERIDEALAQLAPERPGVADVYFVGFAGDGFQRVFRREAIFAQEVFAKRMGSGPRSLQLINDKDDRITYPLATASSLRYGLARLAARMNTDEDVLVLLLTSHGSKEDGLYVANDSLPLNDMDPEAVQRALDSAGIRWRIIIVSACYSGTFIEPLKNDETMLITASDAVSTSFGCADDRDLTYFGEAFLRDALTTAATLEAAYIVASRAIADRERAEKLTASNPQIFVGDSIGRKLQGMGEFPLAGPPAPEGSTEPPSQP